MQLVFPGQALFRRELNQTLRGSRYYWFMALALLMFVAGVVAQWPDARMQADPQYMAGFSVNVVRALSAVIAFLVCLLIPAIAGSSIALERENETYDLLHVTLIRPVWIVTGKLVTSLAVLFLYALAMLPVAGAVFFLVGVSWSEFAMDYVIIALFAIACGAAAVCASAFFRRTVVAMAVAYALMLLVAGMLFPLLMTTALFAAGAVEEYSLNNFTLGIISHELFRAFATLFENMSTLTPFYLLFGDMLAVSGLNIRPPDPGIITYAIVILALTAATTFFYFLAVWRTGLPPVQRTISPIKPIDDAAQLEARRKKFPYYLIDPMKRKDMIGDARNPMMVKELRWGLLGELSRLVRIFYAALVVSTIILCGLVVDSHSHEFESNVRGAMVFVMLLDLLLLPALVANMITKEHEQGNMDMLRMTLITPRDVILGKLTAGFLTMLPFYLATLFAAGLLFFMSYFIWHETGITWAVLQGLITLFVVMGFTVSLTVFVSACTRNTQTAIVVSYLLGLLAMFGGILGVMFYLETFPLILAYVFNDRVALQLPWETYYRLVNEGSALSPLAAYRQMVPAQYATDEPWLISMVLFTIGAALVTALTVHIFKRSRAWSN